MQHLRCTDIEALKWKCLFMSKHRDVFTVVCRNFILFFMCVLFVPEPVEEDPGGGNCVTQVHLEKQPLNGSSNSSGYYLPLFLITLVSFLCDYCNAYVLQWIATIVNVVRAGQRLESTEPLTVSGTGSSSHTITLTCLHSAVLTQLIGIAVLIMTSMIYACLSCRKVVTSEMTVAQNILLLQYHGPN